MVFVGQFFFRIFQFIGIFWNGSAVHIFYVLVNP